MRIIVTLFRLGRAYRPASAKSEGKQHYCSVSRPRMQTQPETCLKLQQAEIAYKSLWSEVMAGKSSRSLYSYIEYNTFGYKKQTYNSTKST